MVELNIFSPNTTGTISATTTSANLAISESATAVRIYNAANVMCFVRFGRGSGTAAVTTDMPIAPGSVEVFKKGRSDYVAAITASGSGTVYITAGDGA